MFVILAAILFVSVSLYASPKNDKEDLVQLRSRIEIIQKELLSKEAKKLEAADSLQEIESAISHTNRKLGILAKKKYEIEVGFKQMLVRHRQIRATIEELIAQLSTLIYYRYLQNSPNHFRLLLKQQDPNQIARNLYYISRLSRARSENIDALKIQLIELKKLTEVIHSKRAEVRKILVEQAAQKKWLEQEKIKRKKLLSLISEQIVQQQQNISKLKRDGNRLSALTREINTFVTYQNSQRPIYNEEAPNGSIQERLFSSLKGHLNLPVRGELVSSFGSPRSGANVTWKGLFIQSPSGSVVKAVAGGRIVFADWLRGFGNLMIIDHGNSYMSLYGNNETMYKQLGDEIRFGDTIATVGNSGGNLNSGLYFELRYKGKPFDPMEWMKIE